MALLSEGDFEATILRGYLGFKFSGETAACLTLGIRDAAGAPFKVTWEGGLDGRYLGMTIKSLRRAGLEGNDLRAIATLQNRKVNVTVKHKTAAKSGNVYLVIYINSGRPMTEAEASDLADSLKDAIAALGLPEEEGTSSHEEAEGSVGEPAEREPGGDEDGGLPS